MLAPHLCVSCGEESDILCIYCIYDINEQHESRCISCWRSDTQPREGVCVVCSPTLPYVKAWYGGVREGALKQAIDTYKFSRAFAAANSLVTVLNGSVPQLPEDTQVVAVPTALRHVRRRGYDHAYEIAKRFALMRNLQVSRVLRRTTIAQTQQHGSTKAERMRQAEIAFTALPCSGRFLLIDDIVTTGATVKYAAKALLDAGADEVWVAAVARQPSRTDESLLQ